ncbi:hypothetical protein [uncultured Flavobacterium sp.]|uniref:hypothetical protein n=1 Tax=uncultured Flavobacterium sp. TaxID=165435 RepID=UPI0025F7A096|nr:hypothetical protein [uncultured Flavobacterium sp.]
MDKISIPLQKRKGKFILSIFVAVLAGWGFLAALSFTFTTGLTANSGIAGGILFLFLILLFVNFNDLNKLKSGTLTIESDGVIIRFYISYQGGTAKMSEDIKLERMSRFYIVHERRALVMVNKRFEFEPKTLTSVKKIDIFPSLLEINKQGFTKIMNFVGQVAPEIKLGYGGSALSNLIRR